MKTIIITLFLVAFAVSAGDRCTVRVHKAKGGRGWNVKPQLYKGGNKPASYYIHVYTMKGPTNAIVQCRKITVEKGATYSPLSCVTMIKGRYGAEVYRDGKRMYSKLKGKHIKALAKRDTCSH